MFGMVMARLDRPLNFTGLFDIGVIFKYLSR